MGVQKYAICPHCGRELKRNRENFKRSKNKETGKEEYHWGKGATLFNSVALPLTLYYGTN